MSKYVSTLFEVPFETNHVMVNSYAKIQENALIVRILQRQLFLRKVLSTLQLGNIENKPVMLSKLVYCRRQNENCKITAKRRRRLPRPLFYIKPLKVMFT